MKDLTLDTIETTSSMGAVSVTQLWLLCRLYINLIFPYLFFVCNHFLFETNVCIVEGCLKRYFWQTSWCHCQCIRWSKGCCRSSNRPTHCPLLWHLWHVATSATKITLSFSYGTGITCRWIFAFHSYGINSPCNRCFLSRHHPLQGSETIKTQGGYRVGKN